MYGLLLAQSDGGRWRLKLPLRRLVRLRVRLWGVLRLGRVLLGVRLLSVLWLKDKNVVSRVEDSKLVGFFFSHSSIMNDEIYHN